MDAIITYVNGSDPKWLEQYRKYAPGTDYAKRYRDWGTLKYLLRGIDSCMPFVDKVHLVVASDGQVPQWADRSRLHIVLHSDIIPCHLLPLFNSCTIEMYLHRIEGLAEEFIYFNDDMFPLLACKSSDFFSNGKGVIGMSRCLFAGNMYKRQCRTSDRMARTALGLKSAPTFMRPQHICSPMLKSQCAMAFAKLEHEILATSTRFRTPDNPNQYLFLDYMFYNGKIEPRRISNRHISQGVWTAEKIADYITNPHSNFACINDVEMSNEKHCLMKDMIIKAFEKRFPQKSPYES